LRANARSFVQIFSSVFENIRLRSRGLEKPVKAV
jgi:hypothetical protein